MSCGKRNEKAGNYFASLAEIKSDLSFPRTLKRGVGYVAIKKNFMPEAVFTKQSGGANLVKRTILLIRA